MFHFLGTGFLIKGIQNDIIWSSSLDEPDLDSDQWPDLSKCFLERSESTSVVWHAIN